MVLFHTNSRVAVMLKGQSQKCTQLHSKTQIYDLLLNPDL